MAKKKFSAKQIAAQKKFAKRAKSGYFRKSKKSKKRATASRKVRKQRVIKKSKMKVRHTAGLLGGLNKKGAIINLITFYMANGFGELQSIYNNGGSMYAIRDSLYHMRKDHTLPYYAWLASIWKWGDCGVLNAIGLKDIQIHRKPAAVAMWVACDFPVTESLTNGIQALKDGRTNDAIFNAQRMVTISPISTAAIAVSTYKWGSPITGKI